MPEKVVLITGASGSLGRGVAVAFAKEGWKVSLNGRDETRLKETAKQCQAAGLSADHVHTVIGDVTKAEDTKRIVDSTVEKLGQLDCLINGAGILRAGVFLNTKMTDYDAIFNTNLRSVFLMCKAAMGKLIDTKGSIINISSFTGSRPCYAYFAYSMAASCVDQLTKALALELGPKGVRVNAVCPGSVRDTEVWSRQGAPLASAPPEKVAHVQEGQRKLYPLGRLAEVDDVVNCIMFLASDKASYVHGVCLPVDGGKILTSKPVVDVPVVA